MVSDAKYREMLDAQMDAIIALQRQILAICAVLPNLDATTLDEQASTTLDAVEKLTKLYKELSSDPQRG